MANLMLAEVQKSLSQNAPAQEKLALPDVIVTTTACLAVSVLFSVPGWIYLSGSIALYLGLLVVSMFLGVYVARRAPVSPALALGYSAVLGLIVGAFSHLATLQTNDNFALITQAILGTVAGAVGMLLVYATPFGRKASRSVRLFAGLAIGYLVISLLSIVASLFGVGGGWGFYGVGPLGLVLCAIGVAMACWSLLIDIGRADTAIATGAPRSYSWSLGMALASSIIWVYLEILRLLSILNR